MHYSLGCKLRPQGLLGIQNGSEECCDVLVDGSHASHSASLARWFTYWLHSSTENPATLFDYICTPYCLLPFMNLINVISYQVIENVVKFISSYTTETGLPMPAAPHGRDNQSPIYLPASASKLAVFKRYVDACNNCSPVCKSVGLTLFKKNLEQLFATYSVDGAPLRCLSQV